jgi:hypothetical protein
MVFIREQQGRRSTPYASLYTVNDVSKNLKPEFSHNFNFILYSSCLILVATENNRIIFSVEQWLG